MTKICVRDLLGIGNIPQHRTAAGQWLQRRGVEISERSNTHYVNLTDLPDHERTEYLRSLLENSNIELGQLDNDAHDRLLFAKKYQRDKAIAKAQIACELLILGNEITWDEKYEIIVEKHGKKGNSVKNLQKLMRDLEGIDPINFAPALLPKPKGCPPKAKMSDEAWNFFKGSVAVAHENLALKAIWCDVRDLADGNGWDWPSWETVNLRMSSPLCL